ncbi:hypothetical protein EYF80_068094 [Liparis tanakae]|uniref:Uncharacterized protein n=1 Tax=Liparis tanakae TaxID=230148 RepID=A0A4Z2DZ25_9TELE|nr:hypothetical protein EYF80_068094 [Liparis tanakae]
MLNKELRDEAEALVKKVVVGRNTVPLGNVTLKQADTRVPLSLWREAAVINLATGTPVRVSHLRGTMSDYGFQLQSTLNTTVDVCAVFFFF